MEFPSPAAVDPLEELVSALRAALSLRSHTLRLPLPVPWPSLPPIREVFGLSTGLLSIADQLIHLQQGGSSASDLYSAVPYSGGLLWMERDGATHCLPTRFGSEHRWQYDDNVGLESFMQKAVKISQCLTTCQPDETAHSPTSPAACSPVPEPMLCLYCGVPGHFIKTCPSCPPRPACQPSWTRGPQAISSPKPSYDSSTYLVRDRLKIETTMRRSRMFSANRQP